MTMVNATNFRKDMFGYLSKAIEYNEVINVTTKEGNAVVLSEDAYNGLMETLYLYANPKVRNEIIDGINTPLADCVAEDEVIW